MNTHKTNIKSKILLIEDDVDMQDLLVSFFKPRGYETIVYNNAQEALEDFEKNKISCDVIITDLILPGISGIEFTKNMKALGAEMPIILMTGNKKVEIAVEAISAGAYDFVVKPVHFPQLLVSVERALHLAKVKEENSTLKTAVHLQSNNTGFNDIIGRSPGFRQALELAKRVSKSTANVLINGESGSGKEVIAKAIHNMGSRKKGPFVAINCSSIPENLLESELFGHSKGAFTGASDKRVGLFEEAEGGTLFLDEIGDLSQPLQAKLLRVLQERKIKRIGENQFRNINVRIISATHKDLKKEIMEKRFREDLFFRLNVIPILVPPLRDRKEDIIPLAEFFLKKFCSVNEVGVKTFSKDALEALLANPWKGNVRELENTIERAVVLSESDVVRVEDVTPIEETMVEEKQSGSFDFNRLMSSKILTIEELTKMYVQYVLKINHGAKEKTAKDLDIDRKTLYRRLSEIEKETVPQSLASH